MPQWRYYWNKFKDDWIIFTIAIIIGVCLPFAALHLKKQIVKEITTEVIAAINAPKQ